MSTPNSSNKPTSASSLIVISNRLPVNLKRSEQGEWKFDVSSGGLVAALCGLKMSNFTWVGWPGCDVKLEERDYVTKELAKLSISCVPVWLDDKLADKHYNGFSNSVLWPLFHYLEDIQFDDDLYDAYKEVNYRFAQVVNSIYKKGDLVWVHDYHLMLMPRILRKRFNPNLPMGFFLHIPFPSSEIYRIFPNGRALLKGVLSCDLVGFHTWEYCRHFMKTATRILGVERLPNAVRFNNQTVPVGVFPVGIDPSKFSEMLEKPDVLERVKGLRETFGNKKVLLGVDRLDYIKGVPHKLWGYEMFLQQHPEWLGKVVLLQVAVPSRTDVEEYVKLKEEVEELVGRINSRFGDVDFNPVHYMFRSVNFAELCAMYRVADGLLITSLRDGMNLVCQEYVVSQDYQDPGLLILSEFAGAAGALSGSYRVNPWNSGEVAEAIYQAVSMPIEQRRARFQEDIAWIHSHTAADWGISFIAELEKAVKMREQQKSMIPLFKMLDEVKSRYVTSKNRLVILNYDVAIIPLTALPNISLQPSPALVQALLKLSEDPKNTIFVHSGRSSKQLESSLFPHPHAEESHCDSSKKKIGMSAELGYMCRGPYDDEWQRLSTDLDLSWRDLVKPVLEDFTNRTPGSFIEQKQVSLVWHYRNCDSDYGPLQARELHLHLDSFYHDKHSPIDLQMNDSLSALIIQPCGVSFANVLRKYLSPQPQTPHLTGDERETSKSSKHKSLCTEPIDFVLYVGEGTLTEEMIRDIIQADANTAIYTCTVNKKVSQARYSLENTDDVHRVLVNLIQAEHIPMQTPTSNRVGQDL